MMWIVGIAAFIGGIAAAVAVNKALNAVPFGYQDETGFHLGHEPGAILDDDQLEALARAAGRQ